MPTLFLRVRSEVTSTEDGPHLDAEWLVREADGSVRGSGVTDSRGLAEIIDTSAEWAQDPANIVVMIPAEHVLTVRCKVPGRNAAQIRRALPYAVEEFVTEDIDTLHLAHGAISGGQDIECALIKRTLIDEWLAALRSLSLSPGFLVADAAMLPGGPGTVSVLFEGDTALVRTPDQMASIDTPNVVDVLEMTLDGIRPTHDDADNSDKDDAGDPLMTGPQGQSAATGQTTLNLINGTLPDIALSQFDMPREHINVEALDGSILQFLANRWFEDLPPINLLQGELTPTTKRRSNANWGSVIALAAVWFAVAVGVHLAEGYWAERTAGQYRAEAASLHKEVYGTQRVRDVYQHMRGQLGRSDAADRGVDFHVLLGELASGMKSTVKSPLIRSVSYSDSRVELSVELTVSTFNELDALKEKLTEMGLGTDISSAEQEANQVRARLKLKDAGAA